MDRIDKVYKLHHLLKYSRYPVSRGDLECKLECSKSTVERVIRKLRDYLGAPVAYDRGKNGYYYAHGESFELPGFWLNQSEVHTLFVIQQLLQNMHGGVLEDYFSDLGQRVEKILASKEAGGGLMAKYVAIKAVATRTIDQQIFRTIADALAKNRRILIVYHGRERGSSTERELSPLRQWPW